jgi:hypothetical protein
MASRRASDRFRGLAGHRRARCCAVPRPSVPPAMNRTTAALSLLSLFCLSALPACRWPMAQCFVGAQDQVLASRAGPGGSRETFKLSRDGDSKLVVERELDQERARLGVRLVELDKPRAERRGVRPYSGLLVREVEKGSAADAAGVLPQDVLLSLDGQETVYLESTLAAERQLRADQAVTLQVLRGQQTLDVPLRVQADKERVTEREEVDLEVPASSSRPFAGVTLRGIPAAWCERIYGSARQAVVVTNVEVGSPAWLAGVRPGDVIDTVDGAPVGTVHELSAQIAARGESEQPTTWTVRRGSGDAHEGIIDLDDYSGDSGAWIPLVFHLANGTWQDRWSLGPFGLLLSNRSEYVPDTSTRRVHTRNVFSAVLGLFHVESNPVETEVRLLWFIRFDT